MNKTLFIIISVFFLIWNLMGVGAFVTELVAPEAMTAQMNAEQAEMYNQRPGWYNIAYGIAVITGFLSAILLLARKKHAVIFALISLLGVIATTAYNFYSGSADMVEGADQIFLLGVPVLSVLMLVFARYSAGKGLIR